MVLIRSDPVLMVVGVFLIMAILAGIGASYTIPSDPTQKVTKYTSNGKAAQDSPCCKVQGSFSAGCATTKGGECPKTCSAGQQGCSRNCPAIGKNK